MTSPVWGWISDSNMGETYQSPEGTPRFADMVCVTLGLKQWFCACITIKKKWERSQCLGLAGCMYSCFLFDQNCRSEFFTAKSTSLMQLPLQKWLTLCSFASLWLIESLVNLSSICFRTWSDWPSQLLLNKLPVIFCRACGF